jgi:hypothetical protein
MTRHRAAAAPVLALALAAGCVSTQTVRIACVPRDVSVYVDGQLLEGNEAALRTDRAHKIFAKGPGYEPRLVVIEPETGDDGRPVFRDDELCMQVVPIGMGRELEVEVEPGEAADAPAR